MLKTLYGVFGIVGRWPHWRQFFDLSNDGAVRSFLGLILCYPALWLVLSAVETERARLMEAPPPELSVPLFALIITLWLGSFHLSSALIAVLMGKTAALREWWVVRNWALIWVCVILGVVFAITTLGLPFIVAYGALFAAYLGLLAIDIRIAQRAADFAWGTAILVACVIVSTSMVVLLISILRILQP